MPGITSSLACPRKSVLEIIISRKWIIGVRLNISASPLSTRLPMPVRNKLCVTKYNIGMHHIKNKDYLQALHYMELVLELDPQNVWAAEKSGSYRNTCACKRR